MKNAGKMPKMPKTAMKAPKGKGLPAINLPMVGGMKPEKTVSKKSKK